MFNVFKNRKLANVIREQLAASPLAKRHALHTKVDGAIGISLVHEDADGNKSDIAFSVTGSHEGHSLRSGRKIIELKQIHISPYMVLKLAKKRGVDPYHMAADIIKYLDRELSLGRFPTYADYISRPRYTDVI